MRRHHHRPAHRRPRQPAPEDAGPPPQPRPATRLRPEPGSRLGRRAPGRRPPRAPGNRSLAPHVTTPPRPTAEPSRAEPSRDRTDRRPGRGSARTLCPTTPNARAHRTGRVCPNPRLSGHVCPNPRTAAPTVRGTCAPTPIYRGLCAPSPKRERPARPRIRVWATVLPAQDSRPRTPGPGLPRAANHIPTKTIDFIDTLFYRNGMSHRTPLVTRRYADFGSGTARSARCPAPPSR